MNSTLEDTQGFRRTYPRHISQPKRTTRSVPSARQVARLMAGSPTNVPALPSYGIDKPGTKCRSTTIIGWLAITPALPRNAIMKSGRKCHITENTDEPDDMKS